MKLPTIVLGILLAGMACAAPLMAADRPEKPAAKPVSLEVIARLIQQLGDDDFFARERAQQELARIGTAAFDALNEAENSDDIEIADRARYLARMLTVHWVTDKDAPDARMLMEQYLDPDREDLSRRRLITMMATLPDGHGVPPLCRLARFEQSQVLSKLAALAVIDQKVLDNTWDTRAKIIEDALGTSGRPAAKWLREYVRTHGNAGAQADVWRTLAEEESRTLTQFPHRTSVTIVQGLLRQQVMALRSLNRGEESLAVIDKMVILEPESNESLQELFGWLVEAKAWAALDKATKRFSDRFQDDPMLLYTLAQGAQEQGNHKLAQEISARARSLNPENVNYHLVIGNKLRKQGLFDWSEQEYRLCSSIGGPTDFNALTALELLADMLHDLENDRAAAVALKEAVEAIEAIVNGGNETEEIKKHLALQRSNMLYFEACAAQADRDPKKQLGLLLKAIEADPTQADVLIALYRLPNPPKEQREKTLQMINAAAEIFRKQIRDTPDEPSPYNQLAWLIGNTEGDQDEALECSQKSLEMEPGAAGFLDTLGRCYFARRDYANAVKYQTQAVELEPHSGAMIRQLKLFQETLAKQGAGAGGQGSGKKKP